MGKRVVKTPIPDDWYAELEGAAEAQGLSVAALLRLLIRDFLRLRYSDRQREVLR